MMSASIHTPADAGESASRPVGVFDSGVGGLTVVSAIRRLLPGETIVYLGDTARVPYGNKSPETILRYARQDVDFLRRHDIKALVVACNTATAHALESLRGEHPFPVLGVIDPGVEAALQATTAGRIGIIGTAGTIQSGAYQKALLSRRADLHLTALPTPLLVPLVEEDWLTHPATRLVLAHYLEPLRQAGIDTLVLACTHYPLLKPLLSSILGPAVNLVDSAENMALALRACLESHGLRHPDTAQPGTVAVHVTDRSHQFATLARRFLGASLGEIGLARLEG